MTIDDIRGDLPFLERCIYFNHSAYGPLSGRVRSAIHEGLAAQSEGSLGASFLEARVPVLKQKIARLINASPDEIAVVRNTVEALSTVANGISWRQGDNVVTDDIEFPANIYPWLNLKARFGVDLRLVAARGGRVVAEDLIAASDARTRVITVSFVQFSNGFRTDLGALQAMCSRRDIRLCVDAIQGVGPLSVDAGRDRLDFLACGGHKWLLGPIGIGFLYVRKALQDQLWPSEAGHLSVIQDEHRYTHYHFEFRPDARKFEGGVPNYAGVFGLDASLNVFLDIGPAEIETRVLALTDQLCDGLAGRGYRVMSPRGAPEKSAIVSFAGERHSATDLVDRLFKQRIIVNVREGAVRVAPHFYNTPAEIEAFLAALPTP